MPYGCGHDDCFTCPFPDCSVDDTKIPVYQKSEARDRAEKKRLPKRKEERAAWREQGLCTRCGGKRESDRYRMCWACRKRFRELKMQENRRKGVLPKFLLNGVDRCSKCGQFPPYQGHKLCQRCYEDAIYGLKKAMETGAGKTNGFAKANHGYWLQVHQKQAAREAVRGGVHPAPHRKTDV